MAVVCWHFPSASFCSIETAGAGAALAVDRAAFGCSQNELVKTGREGAVKQRMHVLAALLVWELWAGVRLRDGRPFVAVSITLCAL